MHTRLKDLAEKHKELVLRKKALQEELKVVDGFLSESKFALFNNLEEADLESIRVENVGLITRKVVERPSIKNQDLFFDFLHKNGFEDLIKLNVNAKTLESWYKNEGKSLIDTPEEIGLSVFCQKDISYTKR